MSKPWRWGNRQAFWYHLSRLWKTDIDRDIKSSAAQCRGIRMIEHQILCSGSANPASETDSAKFHSATWGTLRKNLRNGRDFISWYRVYRQNWVKRFGIRPVKEVLRSTGSRWTTYHYYYQSQWGIGADDRSASAHWLFVKHSVMILFSILFSPYFKLFHRVHCGFLSAALKLMGSRQIFNHIVNVNVSCHVHQWQDPVQSPPRRPPMVLFNIYYYRSPPEAWW